MKVEKLQISSTSKKMTSDKVSGTPNINNEFSSDLQSLSTLASSNKTGHKDITLLYSDDEFEELQGNLVKSSKPSHSPERKMSNENEKMLPPRAKDCDLLRAPFASNLTFASNASKSSQQSPKPMTILGFLQKSTNSLLQYDSKKRVEKADSLCQTTFSLISSSGKSGANLPNLTLV